MNTSDEVTIPEFKEKFDTFYFSVVELVTKHQHRSFPKEIEMRVGSRYVKISVGGSAWCFVDRKNGNVLKPASWSAPAKHARGNIFDDHNGMKYITPYGPAYLR